ncbi:hypothetical protein [Roseovarius indicus]|uniref:Uncharacterized protein n=1 Tax=Roseovarius indicus TaxID=540747 RepID=A0A0T5P3Y0_9RHOB|nr:hypothetical protein [Roseovarius indicus]KRS15631.1 hypothetical protein XM52_22585 [Roseovarius indicus]QEW27862.1 hypothetical protein RIdsm_03683 [Roseovarius indicus]SFE79049.1 hypothetical protein SAMN04488031_1224 [Roseovarius indicus]|tara:strand:- start:163 stop:363 length:201 start_codon:yes stop_codon:yes gene_type:complete
MTHPAFHSISDAIEALEAALESANLTLIQRQVLSDMRDDLHGVNEIDTFSDVCKLAILRAQRGHFF